MTSIPPATAHTERPRKRPFYLVVALIVSSLFGVVGALDGCNRVAYYRGAKLDHFEDGLAVESNRAAVRGAVDGYLQALDKDRRIVFPLSVADIVLGMTMFLMAAGAMAGRDGARRGLAQVVIVRVGVALLAYGITPRVRAAEMDLNRVVGSALLREAETDSAQAEKSVVQYNDRLRIMPVVSAGALALKTAAMGVIVLALTRRRTREFYAAAAEE